MDKYAREVWDTTVDIKINKDSNYRACNKTSPLLRKFCNSVAQAEGA